MKVGEIFTVERTVNGGTGYQYAPVRISGEVALVGMEKESVEMSAGAPEIQRFVFQCLRSGKAELQFARFRSFEPENALFEEVMSFTVEPVGLGSAAGAWTPFGELGEDDKAVFAKVQALLKGVDYTPEKVSKQVVNGVNYRFACTGKVVASQPATFPAIVKAHVSPSGEVDNVDVQRVLL